MKKRIAVENSLQNVKEYLTNKGYEVATLSAPILAYDETDYDSGDENYYDAIVISGQSENLMGSTRITTDARVIDASGKTPDDIYNQIKGMLR